MKPKRGVAARIVIGPALAALCLLAAAMPVGADDIRQGQQLMVGSSETVDDDLYMFAGTIDVEGTVNGSALLFGGNITVGGTVSRDLMVTGGNVNVTGEVKGSIRMAGGTLNINAPVGEDVVVAGGNITLGEKATVGRDVVIGGGTVSITGPVGRKILAGAGDVTIRGPVGGDVQAYVDKLRLERGANIQGRLTYWSNNEAAIASGASVKGRIERREPPGRNQTPAPVQAFIGWLQALVGLLAVGLILLLILPGFTARATGAIRSSPWASLGLGVEVLIGVPIAAILIFILGLFVGGWWLALFGLAAYILACIVGFVISGLLAGQWILEQLRRSSIHPIWALLLGLVVLTIVTAVPIVGGVIGFLAVVFGLGALTLALARSRARPSAVPAPPPQMATPA
jgi:cytoskeletal protein CcmA (bactofilin family)